MKKIISLLILSITTLYPIGRMVLTLEQLVSSSDLIVLVKYVDSYTLQTKKFYTEEAVILKVVKSLKGNAPKEIKVLDQVVNGCIGSNFFKFKKNLQTKTFILFLYKNPYRQEHTYLYEIINGYASHITHNAFTLYIQKRYHPTLTIADLTDTNLSVSDLIRKTDIIPKGERFEVSKNLPFTNTLEGVEENITIEEIESIIKKEAMENRYRAR